MSLRVTDKDTDKTQDDSMAAETPRDSSSVLVRGRFISVSNRLLH